MSYWWLIVAMALVTFIPRYLPMAFANKLNLPPLLLRALEFVPIAVLSVIIAQAAFYREGVLLIGMHNIHLMASIVALIVAIFTRHMFATIIAGLLAFTVLRFILA